MWFFWNLLYYLCVCTYIFRLLYPFCFLLDIDFLAFYFHRYGTWWWTWRSWIIAQYIRWCGVEYIMWDYILNFGLSFLFLKCCMSPFHLLRLENIKNEHNYLCNLSWLFLLCPASRAEQLFSFYIVLLSSHFSCIHLCFTPASVCCFYLPPFHSAFELQISSWGFYCMCIDRLIWTC